MLIERDVRLERIATIAPSFSSIVSVPTGLEMDKEGMRTSKNNGRTSAKVAGPSLVFNARNQASSAFSVTGPTTPSAVKPRAVWKASMACWVCGPQLPSVAIA
jgi:hypothetical protein